MQIEIDQKNLVHKNENKYYWLVLIVSIITYIGLAFTIVGIFIMLGFFVLSLLFHALMMGNIRINAVKLSEKQFPDVFRTAEQLCEQMEIPRVPDIYVMESGGILNAFATRFFGRNMVVLYSDFFELVRRNKEDEVAFVLAHELVHIKRKHVSKLLFIMPAMWMPGLAELYLRACEYTCDRCAAYFIGNTEAAKNSLTILAIGKTLYQDVDQTEYIKQVQNETGFFVWLSEKLSTHPPLPKRINEIEVFFGEKGEDFHDKEGSKKKVWIWVPASILAVGFLGFGAYAAVKLIPVPDLFSDWEAEFEAEGEVPPVIDAVVKGDTKRVAELLDAGEDVNQKDFSALTPLHWAVQDANLEMVEVLLAAGADPNYEDYGGMTPLMYGAERGYTDIVTLLVEKEADPNYENYDGMTSLFYAVFSDNLETVQILLERGADVSKKDMSNMTVLMHAIQMGNRDIVELLKKASLKSEGGSSR